MNLSPGDSVVVHHDGSAFTGIVDWTEDDTVVILAQDGGRIRVPIDLVVPHHHAPDWLLDLVRRGRTYDKQEREAMSQDGWRRRRDANLRELFKQKGR